MAVTGFLLIITANGKVREVCENIQNFKGVTETYMMYGDYNILVKVRVDLPQGISEIVSRVNKLPNISKVNAMIGLQFNGPKNLQEQIDAMIGI